MADFNEAERKVIEYFLSRDNRPSFKREITEGSGLNKAVVRETCDKFEDKILKKAYKYVPRTGYLLHYSISEDFPTFARIAENFISSDESSVFFGSKYVRDMFKKYGYSKLFKYLGIERRGPFEFCHKIHEKIASDYGSIRKRLFTYALFYPDSATDISRFIYIAEESPFQIPVVLEEMRKEGILLKKKGKYGANPEFLRESLKDYPELYPFLKGKEMDELLSIVRKKFGEYLKRKSL
jgi:hypothetical protein